MPGVPGKGGPAPKRSDQRRRRNKVHVDKAESDGEVRGPKLSGQHSAVARRWYEALRRSGQSQFYEPSDWAAAELVVMAIDSFNRKPSAMMLASIHSMMGTLLVTEGDRRRVRLELEKPVEESGDVSWIDDARQRLRSAG